MSGIWDKLVEIGIGCVVIGMAWAIIAIIIGCPIMWLWNWIMPHLFGLPEVSYWMACGISILIALLFGGVKLNFKKDR